MSTTVSNVRPQPDKVLVDTADYVTNYRIESAEAYDTARLCLMDTLGCGLEALEYPACTKLLGPIVRSEHTFGCAAVYEVEQTGRGRAHD